MIRCQCGRYDDEQGQCLLLLHFHSSFFTDLSLQFIEGGDTAYRLTQGDSITVTVVNHPTLAAR